MDPETMPLSPTALEEHERFMAESRARWAAAAEADRRRWALLVQAVAELQARRGFWQRLFGLR